jgi:uncharacterized membrane protein
MALAHDLKERAMSRTMLKTLCAGVVAAILCLAGLAPAANVRYAYRSTGKYPGAGFTNPQALNDTQIVGEFENAKTVGGYIEDIPSLTGAKHHFSAIVPPGSHTSYASGINKRGIVVGGVNGDGFPVSKHGFSYDHGTYKTIDYPGAKSTAVYGINDPGQIVGGYCLLSTEVTCGGLLNPTDHGFLDDHGTFTAIDFPGASGTQPMAINYAGVIVGSYDVGNAGPYSFLYRNGNFTNIDFPGANITVAYAVNNLGVVAGVYRDSKGQVHGFLYHAGKFQTVDHPNASGTGLTGVNDAGDIVGIWDNPYSEPFIGFPVALPR